MSIVTNVWRMISDARSENRRPTVIEMGEKQARDLADEWNAHIPTFDPNLSDTSGAPYEPPKPVTWEQVLRCDTRLFGTRIVGVESPDYLAVLSEQVA